MITGGKSFVSSPPAFSNDAKKLLVCTGNTVSVFSTATGLQVTELEGHTALVTSVIVVPAPTPASRLLCYCWTASLDGTIKYWDFSVPELIKTINVRFPIHSMVIPALLAQQLEINEKRPDLFAYISVEDTKKDQEKQRKNLSGQILKCNLSKSRLVRGVILAEVDVHTENYCIQFYNLFDDPEISEVQVCERNHQPSDDVTMQYKDGQNGRLIIFSGAFFFAWALSSQIS